MTVSQELMNELRQINKKANQEKLRLVDLLSPLDRALEKSWQSVVNSKFDVMEGYRLMKEQQEILRRRRTIKEEIGQLRAIERSICDTENNIDEYLERLYSWRGTWEPYSLEEIENEIKLTNKGDF